MSARLSDYYYHLPEDLIAKRPLSEREKLENALQDAIKREDYQKAAECRDALKNLKE